MENEAKENELLRKSLADREREITDLKAGKDKATAEFKAMDEESRKTTAAAQERAEAIDKQAQALRLKEQELSCQIAEMNKQLQSIKQEKANLQTELDNAAGQIQELLKNAKESEKLRNAFADREREIAELKAGNEKAAADFGVRIEEHSKAIAAAKERTAVLEEQTRTCKQKEKELADHVATLMTQAQAAQTEKENLQAELNRAAARIESFSMEAKELESLRKTQVDREKEIAELKAVNEKAAADFGVRSEENSKAIAAAKERATVLEKQAQECQQKEKELSDNLAKLMTQAQAAQTEKENLQAELGRASARIESFGMENKELESLRKTQADREKEIAALKAANEKAVADFDVRNGESNKAIAAAKERTAVLEEQARTCQQKEKELSDHVAKLMTQTQTAQTEKQGLQAELDRATARIEKLGRETKELESLRKTQADREKEVAELKAVNEKAAADFGARNEEHSKAIAAAKERTAVLEEQARTCRQKEKELSDRVAKLMTQAQAAQTEKQGLQAELDKASTRTKDLGRETKNLESLRKTLAERENTIAALQLALKSQEAQLGGKVEEQKKQLKSAANRLSGITRELDNECRKSVDLIRKVSALDGRLKEETLYRQGRVIRGKPLKQDDPGLAISLNDVGLMFAAREKYDLAIPLYRDALSILGPTVGMEHPMVAGVMENCADAFRHENDFENAASLYGRALAIAEKTYGKQDLKVAMLSNELGYVCKEQQKYSEAETLYKRSIQIIETVKGANDPLVAGILNNYATLCLSQNRLADAEPLLERAAKIIEAAGGANHPSLIIILQNMAQMYERTGRRQLAMKCSERARNLLSNAIEASFKQ